ncbi:hypothetical protein [Actinoplanes sp. NPDC020271]|uniref:hypothetical protein n=1 Tax=Actinoplanes sp. NPDC020271 TaxID=3363896 RepID=UPI003788597C
MSARVSGRDWAYTGAVLGGAVSIAANVAHSFIPPKEVANPAVWSPETGAVVGAVVWPVFLFIAVEILARIAWPGGWQWQLLRWGGMLPVAAVAALVSYRHLSGLLDHYGEETIVCVLGPLAVDGLMVMATGALLATGHHRHTPEPLAATAVPADEDALRVPALITAPTTPPTHVPVDVPTSVADTKPASPAPVAPEAQEPARSPESSTSTTIPTPAVVASRVAQPGDTPARPVAKPDVTAWSRRPHPSTAAATANELARPATDTPVTEPDAAQLTLPLVPPALLERARDVAERYHADNGEPIKAGQLAARLKVNSSQAAEALAALSQSSNNSPTPPTPAVNGRRPSMANR